MKSLERKIAKSRKAQFIGEVFKYGLVGIVSVIILIAGYSMLNTVKERACKTEISKFEIDLKGIDKSLRAGAKELQSHQVPCKADEIYFFDLGKETDTENFNETPVMQDSLKSRSNNVFLVKENEVKHSFYAGNMEIDNGYICFMPQFEKISFYVEGTGKSARISATDNQPECTLVPVNITIPEANKVVEEAFQFRQEEPEKCAKCPTDPDAEKSKIEKTREHATISRRFILKDKKTKVEIRIKAKEGSRLRDFTFYESIPKECVDDLRKYVEERTDEDAEVSAKDDPLIMWTFSEIKGEKKVSYRLNKELSNECRNLIKGLGVAQSIESSSGDE